MKKIVFLSLVAVAVFGVSVNKSLATGNIPLVGVIRWDAWYTGSPMNATDEVALTPTEWHDRLPFYTIVPTDGSTVQILLDTQDQMDTEIAAAKAGKIDYWAFDYYGDSDTNSNALNKYLASSHKSDIKYSFILLPQVMDKTDWLSTTVSHFSDPQYVTVLGGRPLVYAFEAGGPITAQNINDLRATTIAAGLPNPYIVWMDWDVSDGKCQAVGCDAISVYAMTAPGTPDTVVPYSDLLGADQWEWNNFKSSSFKVVPSLGTGWDPRPRWDNPPPWGAGDHTAVTVGSPSEIAAGLQSAADWITANPTVAEPKTILIYAWNEYAEGGWLSPLLDTGTARLDAISQVISNWSVDTTPPTVSITAPANNANVSGAAVAINATAADASGINKVEFYVDGALKGTDTTLPYSYTWNTTSYVHNSSHSLTAKAYDGVNLFTTSAIVNVHVLDVAAPTTAITAPANNSQVSKNSNVTISATASDVSAINKIEFYVNSVLKCTDTTSPYSCVWGVPAPKGVVYTLQTKAYDAALNIGTSANVSVTSK